MEFLRRSRLLGWFKRKKYGGVRSVFLGVSGEIWLQNVVFLWSFCGVMRGECGVLDGAFRALKIRQFLKFILGRQGETKEPFRPELPGQSRDKSDPAAMISQRRRVTVF
jgi:hypothetical protein